MSADYTRLNGQKASGTNEVHIFQNGTELVADSNKNQTGRQYGKVVKTNPGSDTISDPIQLIQFTRVDINGNGYVQLLIGFVSKDERTITGYFIDVNGVRGSFVMRKW